MALLACILFSASHWWFFNESKRKNIPEEDLRAEGKVQNQKIVFLYGTAPGWPSVVWMWPEILCGWSVKPLPAFALWQWASQHGAGEFLYQKRSKWEVVAANTLSFVPERRGHGLHPADERDMSRVKIEPSEMFCAPFFVHFLPAWLR